jgi:hypothetical protein
MAFSPIAFIAPNYSDYGTYWLKAYLPGSTTPKPLAIDLAATTTFAKLQLNVDGFFKSAGGALITPYVDGAYDAYLFETEAEADTNNTAGAIRLADNILPLADEQLRSDLADGTVDAFKTVSKYSSVKFNNSTDMVNAVLNVGEVVDIKERTYGGIGGGIWDVVLASAYPANTYDILASVGSPTLSLKLRYTNSVKLSQIFNGQSTLTNFIPIFKASVGSGIIYVDSTFTVSPFELPSWITIKGYRDESGWSRNAPYETDFKLILAANSNNYMITVPFFTRNWSIENLTLDGNNANQTSYNSGLIRSITDAGRRNFGGLIKGVKCISPKGWSAYLQGGPLNIIDCFFMSGVIFEGVSDLKVSNVDFDGTDGYHGSLAMSNCISSEAMSNMFCFGWGEADPTKNLQEETGTANGSGDITITPTWLYENAPVTVANTLPTSLPYNLWFAHEVSAGVWALYLRPFNSTAAPSQKADFGAGGAVTLRHGGSEAVGYISESTRIGISGARFGGSTGQGLVLASVNRSHFNNIHTFNNNLRGISAASVEVLDSTRNSFSDSQLGEQTPTVSYSLALAQSANDRCSGNIFSASCNLEGALVNQVIDSTVQSYSTRNRWVCTNTSSGSGYQFGAGASENKNKEAGILNAEVTVVDSLLATGANTDIGLSVHNATGVTVLGSDITIPVTADGMYSLDFRFTLDAAPSTSVLYKINGLSTVTPASTARNYSSSQSVAFNISFKATADANLVLGVEAFTADAGLTVKGGSEWSWITVCKVGDVLGS